MRSASIWQVHGNIVLQQLLWFWILSVSKVFTLDLQEEVTVCTERGQVLPQQRTWWELKIWNLQDDVMKLENIFVCRSSETYKISSGISSNLPWKCIHLLAFLKCGTSKHILQLNFFPRLYWRAENVLWKQRIWLWMEQSQPREDDANLTDLQSL